MAVRRLLTAPGAWIVPAVRQAVLLLALVLLGTPPHLLFAQDSTQEAPMVSPTDASMDASTDASMDASMDGSTNASMDVARDAQALADDVRYFETLASTRGFSLGRPVMPVPTPDGRAVLFLRAGPRDPVLRLYELALDSGAERELLTPEALLAGTLEQLTPEERALRERLRMGLRGFTSFMLSRDGSRVLLSFSSRLYVLERSSGMLLALPGEGWNVPQISPDARFVAAVKDNELHVIEVDTTVAPQMRVRALTAGASDTLVHGLAEFVAMEEMGRFQGFWWSPDSRHLAFQQTDLSEVETLYIADPAHPEAAPAQYRYPRAGRTNARVRLGVVSVEGGAPRWIDWDATRFPYLARVDWGEQAAPLTLLVQSRSQREQQLLRVHLETGTTAPLLEERDPAWLNLPGGNLPWWLSDGRHFLWTTEARGDWQLELRHADGSLARVLTPTGFGLRGLLAVDEQKGRVYVTASEHPPEAHTWSIRLRDGLATRLSEGAGLHSAVFSRTLRTSIHTAVRLDGTWTQEVHDARGRKVGALRSVAEVPPYLPRLELTRIRSDPEFHAALVRPRSFRPGQKYPVVLSVYAGPGVRTVHAIPVMYQADQWLADQGFIVVRLDGRGTPDRGRDWERIIAGNLIEVALRDQVEGLLALGRAYPELDLSRVAVTGWSFGGYFAAMALMQRPDIFKVGIVGAPVTDWLDYDTHYTERYLGLPQEAPEAYTRSSVLTWAPKLSRPLLLVHGLTDDNVYFVHSLKLADALFQAGRSFEFQPLPGTHMLANPRMKLRFELRSVDFIRKHLGMPTLYEGANLELPGGG